jgi:hypothetical protein
MERAPGRIHEIPDRIIMLDRPAQAAIPATAIKRAGFRSGKQSIPHEHLPCLTDSPGSPLSRPAPTFVRGPGGISKLRLEVFAPLWGDRHANEDVAFASLSQMESVGKIVSIKFNKNYCKNK